MLGEKISNHAVYEFEMGGKNYYYMDRAISAYTYEEVNGIGALRGTTNLQLHNDSIPLKPFNDCDDAFMSVKTSMRRDSKQLSGIVLDFETKTLYYGDEKIKDYVQRNRPAEYAIMEHFRKEILLCQKEKKK